jgi:hypothetical protein
MRFGFLILGCVLLLATATVQADWVADGVPLCTVPTDDFVAAMVTDNEGGGIAVWTDYRSGSEADLYVGRIDADGNALWGPNGVPVCVQPGNQYSPDIVPDGAGGAIITWSDERSGYVAWDIYAQRIDASGNPLWPVNGVLVCGATGYQTYPHLVSDGQHGAIIVWEDARDYVNKDIYAQRVDGNGNRTWTVDGRAVCTAQHIQQDPVIVSDGSGGAFIAWQDARSGDENIYAQRMYMSGGPQWTNNGLPVSIAAGDQEWPAAVADGSGGVIIAWSDDRNGGDQDIYAQLLKPQFGPIWTADGAALCTVPGHQYRPQLAPDGQGGAIMAWTDLRGASRDVYAQRVATSGTALWSGGGVMICGADGAQGGALVIPDGSGGAIMAWEDVRSGPGYEDIYAQRVDGAGSTLWNEHGKAISSAAYGQLRPAIAPDGSGGAIVAWCDYRLDNGWDIYAQSTSFSATTAVDDDPAPGDAGRFSYPNPCHATARIGFALAQPGDVSLRIYDVSGALVRSIAAGSRDAGLGEIMWDGRNDLGQDVPDGVYLCRVSGPGMQAVKKVTKVH